MNCRRGHHERAILENVHEELPLSSEFGSGRAVAVVGGSVALSTCAIESGKEHGCRAEVKRVAVWPRTLQEELAKVALELESQMCADELELAD